MKLMSFPGKVKIEFYCYIYLREILRVFRFDQAAGSAKNDLCTVAIYLIHDFKEPTYRTFQGVLLLYQG